MSSSFKKVTDIVRSESPFNEVLLDSFLYLAHTSPNIESESLEKHINLVNSYLCILVESNGIDDTIDGLILAFIQENIIEQARFEWVGNFLKWIFVRTIIFHDYGKVNPNFQGDVEKMNNPAFKTKLIKNYVLKSNHSKLGTYLYLVRHFKEAITIISNANEQRLSLFFILSLSYSIVRHHASDLNSVDANNINFKKNELEAMQAFLKNYQINLLGSEAVLANNIFEEKMLNQKLYDPFYENKIKGGFPLFALTKLNFSLLTAADYLATSDYMNRLPVNDLGLITESLRTRVISAARLSKSYNTKAYELADSDYEVANPMERSNVNLNILRQNMAVEVIRSVREHFVKHLFYLEAPTGGGKTNLSMLAVAELLQAHPEINKVFYVFPFTTLITQTHKVILETLNLTEKEVSLLHSKAGFQTTGEDGDYGSKKLDFLNNLFVHYPFCLLTHIRFFDILKTNEKETNYLLHRLANSIVVIDELQSYPPRHWDKMLYFIQHYAHFFNVRFILMSATLPRIDKLEIPLTNRIEFTDLLPQPKEYFTNQNFANRVQFRFDYRNQKLEMEELATIVLEKSEAYSTSSGNQSVFTIIEFIFKKSATLFNEAIGERFFDEVFTLSGTILDPRRKEIINYLKNKTNRDKKVLLITTQVVEAGVDIDMDLGFKNISLIDSDEQLAGRVNRNVIKEPCEVYLFQVNQPSLLYKQDERYQITRDELTRGDHEEILKTKNFEKLYDLVLEKITRINGIEQIQNFNSDYLPEITRLNYRQINNKFKLIEQDNLSVFVPLKLPVKITSSENEEEAVFSSAELNFLSRLGVQTNESCIDGVDVWRTYKSILFNREKDFVGQQIDKKLMSGVLSKFTFSIFSNVSIRKKLVEFSIPTVDREEELRGFDNYVYLARHEDCYDYKKGLQENRFDASENFIL